MGDVGAKLPTLPPDPTVAVVMPVRDGGASLPQAVASALHQAGVSELVIALAPSTDDTAEVAARLAREDRRVHVVDNPSGTTPDGLNHAIAAASADVVVRLDAHAVLPAGYVATAVASLQATGAANVGGRQVPRGADGFERAVAAAMQSPLGSGGARYRSGATAGPADTVYLGVFRRDALDAVGGFDSRFLRNQDAELNERLRRAGYLVWFEPALAVDYRPRSSLPGLARQYFQYGRFRRLTARTHRGSLAARQLVPVALVLVLAGSVAAGLLLATWLVPALTLGGYLLALVGGGVAAGGLRLAVPIAAALGTMHVSWAGGFLLGPPADGGTSTSAGQS